MNSISGCTINKCDGIFLIYSEKKISISGKEGVGLLKKIPRVNQAKKSQITMMSFYAFLQLAGVNSQVKRIN